MIPTMLLFGVVAPLVQMATQGPSGPGPGTRLTHSFGSNAFDSFHWLALHVKSSRGCRLRRRLRAPGPG